MPSALETFTLDTATADAVRLGELVKIPIESTRIFKNIDSMKDGTAPEYIMYPAYYITLAYYDLFRMIGEAAKKLSPAIKSANPEIDWQELVKLRDAAAHWNEPEYEPVLKSFIHRQKECIPAIEWLRTRIHLIDEDACNSESDLNALKDLRLASNAWCAANAFNHGDQKAFLQSLDDENAEMFGFIFERYAHQHHVGALRSLQVKQGNLAAGVSLFFRDALGNASGYNYITFNDIRNSLAHMDMRCPDTGEKVALHEKRSYADPLKTNYIDTSMFREWFEENAAPADLAKAYHQHLCRGLTPEKIGVLEDTAAKLSGNRTAANAKQQQAFLLALSDVGRAVEPETMRTIGNLALPLATAKNKNLNIKGIPKKIPSLLEPLVGRIVETMRDQLRLNGSAAIAA